MKKHLFILVLAFIACVAKSQQRIIDSIKQQMPTTNDTLILVWNSLLAKAYDVVNDDSTSVYNNQYQAYCRKLNLAIQEADAIIETANGIAASNSANAIGLLFTAQRIVEHPANKNLLPVNYRRMLKVPASVTTYEAYRSYLVAKISFSYSLIYYLNNQHARALDHTRKALKTGQLLQAPDLTATGFFSLGVLLENDDSSLYYLKMSHRLSLENDIREVELLSEDFMAQRYASKKDYKSELFYRLSVLRKNIAYGRTEAIGWNYLGMADYYSRSVKIKDSALIYAYKALAVAEQLHNPAIKFYAALHLTDHYKARKNKDSAYKYLEMSLHANEENSSDENARQFEQTDYNRQTERAAIEAAAQQFRNEVKTFSLLAGIGVLTLLAVIFWRNNKRKQKEFKLLKEQKAKTDQALHELKSTQQQLIQSEKMASLGELTAGIAHEIQNPLNFVNNFSEVNNELISELVDEVDKGNLDEVKLIAKGLQENEQKINYHGKRADAIVKGMLQHSRASSGQKEPTNINVLCDEYLRLAYHGLRAKDKSFNAEIKTDFDAGIGKINVVPQDIGRVLLNLFNNAFYAVNEKRQRSTSKSLQPISNEYKPIVSVRTKRINDKLEIVVSDNGNGIPRNIVDKIFQPFFTTKPTGQGTGLGLSLAYDIIKAHGGEIKVETKEGEGSAFVIQLPVA